MYLEENVVRDDWVVYLEYTLRYKEDDELVSTSAEEGYLAFIQGRGHIFPIIEGAAEGMRVGDEMELVMPPEETYGDYDPEAVELLPLDVFPDGVEVTEGLEIELYDEDRNVEIEAIVVEVTEDGAVVDMNHPLAGETLAMWFKIAELRGATEEELEHNHLHDDDAHH